MRRDTAEMHEENDSQALPECNRCKKQFRLNIMLVKHKKECEKMSTKDGTWCPLCNKTVSYNKVFGRMALSIHIVSHSEIEQLIGNMDIGLRPGDIDCNADCGRTGIRTGTDKRFHEFVECKYSLIRLEKFILKLLVEEVDKDIGDLSNKKVKGRDDKRPEMPESPRQEPKIQDQIIKTIRIRKRESDHLIQRNTPVKNTRTQDVQKTQRKNIGDKITNIIHHKNLKCKKCLRYFDNIKQLKDTNEHLCAKLAKEGKSIQSHLFEHNKLKCKGKLLLGKEKRNNGTKGMVRKCTLCPILNRPIFTSDDNLMKHIILAHEFNVLWKLLSNKGMNVFPIECLICKKKPSSGGKPIKDLEEALLHVGTIHREYFKNSEFDDKHLLGTSGIGHHKPTPRNEETRKNKANSSIKDQHYHITDSLAKEVADVSIKKLISNCSQRATQNEVGKNASAALNKKEANNSDIWDSSETISVAQKENTSKNLRIKHSQLESPTYQRKSTSFTRIHPQPVIAKHSLNYPLLTSALLASKRQSINYLPQVSNLPTPPFTPSNNHYSAVRKFHIPYPLYSLESLTRIKSGTQLKFPTTRKRGPLKT